MKHLKNFEGRYIGTYSNPGESVIDYKEGDYVYLKPTYFTDRQMKPGKVITMDTPGFEVELLDGEIIWVTPAVVLKRMNSEEIEQFKLNKSANKYNI